jgi:hypothetical protein
MGGHPGQEAPDAPIEDEVSATPAPIAPIARRLAGLALILPLFVLLLIFIHGLWFQRSGALSDARALTQEQGIDSSTLVPSGVAEREGPGSHPGVDLRFSPRLSLPGAAADAVRGPRS